MAAESEAVGTAQVSGAAGLNSPNPANQKNSPSSNSQIANSTGGVRSFGHIRLDISNSVLPLDKLSPTPSGKDGLSEEVEMQIRSLGCEVIQLSGKLLRLPQVSTSPSRKLLFCGLPVMFWQKNLQRIFEFENIEKQLKKLVKSKCEEGYLNDLTEFKFGLEVDLRFLKCCCQES